MSTWVKSLTCVNYRLCCLLYLALGESSGQDDSALSGSGRASGITRYCAIPKASTEKSLVHSRPVSPGAPALDLPAHRANHDAPFLVIPEHLLRCFNLGCGRDGT